MKLLSKRPQSFRNFNVPFSIILKFIVFFLLCTCYSILRNIKDTVVLVNSGAEVIPFLKVWGIVPGAFFITWLYTKLLSYFRRDHIFYIMITGFLGFFLLFALVLNPYADSLILKNLEVYLTSSLPRGFSGAIAMVCYWHSTLYYIVSELWASIILAVLFWGYLNDVTPLEEAQKTYGILNIGSNLSPIAGGALSLFIADNFSNSKLTIPWDQQLIRLTILVCTLGILAMILFKILNKDIVKTHIAEKSTVEFSQENLSLWESLKHMMNSPYLLSIAILVLCYNASINFTDILWKSELKLFFKDTPEMMISHMNKVTVFIGIISTVLSILFSWMITSFGWTFVASLTPVTMFVTAVGFFVFIFLRGSIDESLLFGFSTLSLSVYFGSMQNTLAKAGKYSVFDASKEIAFLKESKLSRLKAKAAIDGLGSGVGKSGSSLLVQALLLSLGSIMTAAPTIAVVMIALFVCWFFALLTIRKRFLSSQ